MDTHKHDWRLYVSKQPSYVICNVCSKKFTPPPQLVKWEGAVPEKFNDR